MKAEELVVSIRSGRPFDWGVGEGLEWVRVMYTNLVIQRGRRNLVG